MQHKSLAKQMLRYLGIAKPSKKQLITVDSILFNTTLKAELFIDMRLTKREAECLLLTAHGKSSLETGELLNISKLTVETHRRSIKQKFACKTMAQAVFLGIKYGVVHKNIEPTSFG